MEKRANVGYLYIFTILLLLYILYIIFFLNIKHDFFLPIWHPPPMPQIYQESSEVQDLGKYGESVHDGKVRGAFGCFSSPDGR